MECELTREFGVAWVPRADGRGNEIAGVTQAQLDAYSTRTVQVHEKERELAQAWERRHGRVPTARELLYIADDATLRSRKGKDAARVDWDALAARWDATLGGQLAGIAAAVSNARGPDATAPAAVDGSGPAGPLSREAHARAVQKALALVSEKQPAWTRHDLVRQLALVMPTESRRMSALAARELLLGLAEEALSGRGGDVVCLEAPEWPPLPASLRRELDGRSVYTRPGVARYATAAQLSAEERLVAHAQARRAPRLPGELAARRLGIDAELVAAQLRERAQDAHQQATRGGLRLDQAAAVWHVLTSVRTVEVVTGPAGTGKTRVLATGARAWGGPFIQEYRGSPLSNTGAIRANEALPGTCPARKQDCAGDLQVFRGQAARAYSLIRPPRTGFRRICCVPTSVTGARGASGSPSECAGRCPDAAGPCCSAPGTARTARRCRSPRIKHAVEEFSAQGADEPLAGRVHARSLDGGAQDPGSGPSLPRSHMSWHARYPASAVAHAAGNAIGRGDNRKEGHRGRVMPAWRQRW